MSYTSTSATALRTNRRFPKLSANGIFAGGDGRGCRPAPQPIVASQFEDALAFLSRLTPTKTARICSYVLKHIAERWAGSYISNGALIAAALALRLVVETYPPSWGDNPTVAVGVSRKSLKALTARRVTA